MTFFAPPPSRLEATAQPYLRGVVVLWQRYAGGFFVPIGDLRRLVAEVGKRAVEDAIEAAGRDGALTVDEVRTIAWRQAKREFRRDYQRPGKGERAK